MQAISLAIVGTAGRKDDLAKLNLTLYNQIIEKAKDSIAHLRTRGFHTNTLVSGGAAWIDHLAISLFLNGEVDDLVLHLPCAWDATKHQFEDDGSGWKTNPGLVANYHHRNFKEKTGIDSLGQLEEAIFHKQCVTWIGRGFWDRNTSVSRANAIFAATFGAGKKLKPGGTADTVKKYLDRVQKEQTLDLSYHLDLNTLLCWPGAETPK